MVKYLLIISVLIFTITCKKSDQRRCWKTIGETTTLTLPIDSVKKFNLYSKLTYVLHQSNARKIEIIGGSNMVNLVDIDYKNYTLDIRNKSYCHFLRDFDKKIVVHIYNPHYEDIYAEISDSLIFLDTIKGNLLQLEMRESGGVTVLTSDLNDLSVIVSAGVGSFVLNGFAKYATLKTQGQAFGNALGLTSEFLNIYQNSNNNLSVNISNAETNVLINGAGDVEYAGIPKSVIISKNGDGVFVKN